ncbi:MAG TPA: PIG-L family deacetylase [Ktedonobacterales bacterium]|nr:PIG-L family deacetylase [Ktedonobacterales bacterium]
MSDATPSLCLMAVLAHPDDESFSGGLYGKYGDEGVRTVLVTCTLGEEGEIVDPTMDVADVQPRLGEVRTEELKCSVAALGIGQLHMLGYRDSGMAGTPANANPLAFTNVDFESAVARLVALVRRERPQVILCDDENGSYGHPDHIMAHRLAEAAFDGANNPIRFPVAPGEPGPWQPSKLYYTAWPIEKFMEVRQEVIARGLPDPFEGWGSPEEQAEQAPSFLRLAKRVTTTLDVAPYYERKVASFRCHRTQLNEKSLAFALPADLARGVYSEESFTLARSRVARHLPETDLFAGLR